MKNLSMSSAGRSRSLRRKMVAAVELELEYYIRAEKETADIERFEDDDKEKKKCWATLKTLTKSENSD